MVVCFTFYLIIWLNAVLEHFWKSIVMFVAENWYRGEGCVCFQSFEYSYYLKKSLFLLIRLHIIYTSQS